MTDKTLEEIDEKIYSIAKEWFETSIDETRKSMIKTLINHELDDLKKKFEEGVKELGLKDLNEKNIISHLRVKLFGTFQE